MNKKANFDEDDFSARNWNFLTEEELSKRLSEVYDYLDILQKDFYRSDDESLDHIDTIYAIEKLNADINFISRLIEFKNPKNKDEDEVGSVW